MTSNAHNISEAHYQITTRSAYCASEITRDIQNYTRPDNCLGTVIHPSIGWEGDFTCFKNFSNFFERSPGY